MLLLTRKIGEEIVIGHDPEVTVTVIEIDFSRQRVRLGITAPREVPIDRREVRDSKDAA